MRRNSWAVAAALVAGLAVGTIAGPVAMGTTSAQAQVTAQTATAVPTKPVAASDSLRNAFLNQLAADLNVQRSALDSALTSAGTKTIDAAVQQGTLTQAQADALKARIQAGDLEVLLGDHGGLDSDRGAKSVAGVQQALFDAAAKALNITTDEFRTQLRNGQTLAQLAQTHTTTEQAVVNAALAAAKIKLNQLVTAGTITQAQADTTYTQLQQRGAQLFAFNEHRLGRHGLRGEQTTPQATTTPGV